MSDQSEPADLLEQGRVLAASDDLSDETASAPGLLRRANVVLDDAKVRRSHRQVAVVALGVVLMIFVGLAGFAVCTFVSQVQVVGRLATSHGAPAPVVGSRAMSAVAALPAASAASSAAPPASANDIGGARLVPGLPFEVGTWLTSMVAVISILVIASSVLTITLLNATFASHDGKANDKDAKASAGGVTDGLPAAAMLKAILDAVSGVLRGAGGK